MNGESGNAAPRPRYALLDSLRGLLVVSMICYHALYDLVYLKGVSAPWFLSIPAAVWQEPSFSGFLLLSGLCWGLSCHPVKRGLILVGCGAAVTLVTWLAMPQELIQYGVLTFLGLSSLLLVPLDRLFRRGRLSPWAGFAASLWLLFLFRGVPLGYLGFWRLPLWELPPELYQWNLLAVLGFPSPTFTSADYFSLIPWFFLYLAGYFLWKAISGKEKVLKALEHGFRPLSFLGRHSLLIYLLHQPLLIGIFSFL